MNCPNCTESFTLRADYASHVQRCRPLDAATAITESLLARLNAATDLLYVEFGIVGPERSVRRRRVA